MTKLLKKFQTYPYKKLKIDGRIVNLRVADTAIKKMLGLMHEKEISENEGMLFIFDDEVSAPIWMRNMYFPIDVIWIDKNMKIVHYEENIKLRSAFDFKTYGGGVKAKYIIELHSGFLKNINKNKKIKIID